MGLETGTYISDLIATNPVGATDDRATADDHLRLIKAVLKNTFPTSGIYPAFPAGTVMLFMQAAAPTGWTQVVSHNNKALRIVSGVGAGSGGATAFTSVFGATTNTGSTTLSTNQIPAHTHAVGSLSTNSTGSHAHIFSLRGGGGDTGTVPTAPAFNTIDNSGAPLNTSQSAGAHSHTISGDTGNNTTANSGHTHTLTLDLQYVDIIACSKD